MLTNIWRITKNPFSVKSVLRVLLQNKVIQNIKIFILEKNHSSVNFVMPDLQVLEPRLGTREVIWE